VLVGGTKQQCKGFGRDVTGQSEGDLNPYERLPVGPVGHFGGFRGTKLQCCPFSYLVEALLLPGDIGQNVQHCFIGVQPTESQFLSSDLTSVCRSLSCTAGSLPRAISGASHPANHRHESCQDAAESWHTTVHSITWFLHWQ
jgi:hypothetical protein